MRLRRLLLVALAVAPFATAAVAYGCSTSEPFQSACLWMADPTNCWAQFHDDMLANKDASPTDNPSGDCSTPGSPTQATSSTPGTPNGAFLMRTPLSSCLLTLGGSVSVAPPIDLTMWPPDPLADPVTYTFTFMAPSGDVCGSATYTSPHGFSITITQPADAGTTSGMDAGSADAGSSSSSSGGAGGGASADAGPTPMPYGTYLQSIPPGRDAFGVQCPNGESYNFNLNEILSPPTATGAPTSECSRYADILPAASFQLFLGGIDTNGALSLAINYPPLIPPGAPESYGDAGLDAGPPLQPDTVIYFNCTIPAAPELCADGVKDGTETDIDCGGPQMFSMFMCGQCPPRCAAMQQCICDSDCAAGSTCQVDTMGESGMRICQAPSATATSFPHCFYNADAGPPCDAGCTPSTPVDGGPCLATGNTCSSCGEPCCSGNACNMGTCP